MSINGLVRICYFVLLTSVLFACGDNQTTNESTPTLKLLIGTYTDGESEGVYETTFDSISGKLGIPKLLFQTQNPSYLTYSEKGEKIWVVNELDSGKLTLFQNADTGYEQVTSVYVGGSAPCYVDILEKDIVTANYSSGNLSFLRLEEGELALRQTYSNIGVTGSNKERQESAHAHFAKFYNGNVYASDLGIDEVLRFDRKGAGFNSGKTILNLDPGDGPRHLEFHPNNNWVFIINELSNTIISTNQDPETGILTIIDRKSTLPEGFSGESYCADLHISPDGKFLYGSNRGHNSIMVFRINQDGTITNVDFTSVEGDWPRNFTISPYGKWVLVANQLSNDITVFRRNTEDGTLIYTGQKVKVGSPTCLRFVI